MAIPPVIISDDGSPPPLIPNLRVTHPGESMPGLKLPNGRHVIPNSVAINGVTITQAGVPGPLLHVRDRVDVSGDLGTTITVAMDYSGMVVVGTIPPLNEEVTTEFNRYRAADANITKVFIDGNDTGFQPNGTFVHIEVGIS